MKDEEIKPGTRIQNIHWQEGHYTIDSVSGQDDHSIVMCRMDGPAGSCLLKRDRKLIRDHFRVVDN